LIAKYGSRGKIHQRVHVSFGDMNAIAAGGGPHAGRLVGE
jgi:hypothetical protein